MGNARAGGGGPAYRRAKREWQWRRCDADLDVQLAPADDFPYAVMAHSTPMLRQLQGLPMQLQHGKITNLRLGDVRLSIAGPADREVNDELVCENHAQMMYEPFLPPAPVRQQLT